MAINSCRVPVSFKKKVKAKLRDMEQQDIVEKIEQPTESMGIQDGHRYGKQWRH